MVKKLSRLLAFVAALVWATSIASQEVLDPIPVGASQSVTTVTNGQTLLLSASGITATVYLEEVSSTRVTGFVVRTSSGSTAGTVTIDWHNQGRIVTLTLDANNPDDPFGMEGGEGDKRTGSSDVTNP